MQEINKSIQDIVASLYKIKPENIDNWLSSAPKPELGDYTFNIFELAKLLQRNPSEISTELKIELSKLPEIFENVSNLGGYINFFINKNILIKEFNNLDIKEKEQKNETIVIDYIGANLGKPLHIGHICTPIIGQSHINIFKYLGYKIISDSHFGDWGLFGKLVAAYKIFGNKDELIKDPIEYLLFLYVKFTKEVETNKDLEEIARNEFKKLSNGDKENIELWKEFVSYSLNAMNRILEILNVKPDYDIGESFYEGLDLPKIGDYPDLKHNMNDIVKELLDKNIATKNIDGSVGVIFPDEAKISSCVLQKKDGTNLYLTSDLACIKYRLENWNPSKIIYHVDVRQQLHLKQAFWIAKKAWPELENTELFHAFNGFIKLKEGAMSTRKGTIIRLKDLINEGFERTEKILREKGRDLSEENIKSIAVGAIKYSYLSQDREKDIVFDWDKALSFEGNSGPYVQYAYVRAKKILNGAEIGEYNNVDLNSQDKLLIKKLLEFDKKVLDTANKYKPHIIAQYCYELAGEFNSFYVHTPKILEEKNIDLKNFRLSLIKKTAEILKKGFELLAIDMPNEM